jgi:hypothetical protein
LLVTQIIKAVPLQAWSSPGDSKKLRFPDFLTTARDGGKFVSLTHNSDYRMSNNCMLMTIELEEFWKEVVVASF